MMGLGFEMRPYAYTASPILCYTCFGDRNWPYQTM